MLSDSGPGNHIQEEGVAASKTPRRNILSVQVDVSILAAIRRAVAEIGHQSLRSFVEDALREKLENEGLPTHLEPKEGVQLPRGRPSKRRRVSNDFVVLEMD